MKKDYDMQKKLHFILKTIPNNPPSPLDLMRSLVNLGVEYDSDEYLFTLRFLHANVSQEYSDLTHQAFFMYSQRMKRC